MTKKNLFFFCVLLSMLLGSCGIKEQSWEYKIVKVAGKEAEILADYGALSYGDQTTMLNKLGKDGWELVSTYTETTTVFPNFGNSEYVTGIRENVRTSVVNFVFKRPSRDEEAIKPSKVVPIADTQQENTPEAK